MKSIIVLSSFIFVGILFLSSTNKMGKNNHIDFDTTVYYSHEQNCLTTNKRCDLEIVKWVNKDTIIYVSSSETFGDYEEVWGKTTPINDSIYYVKSFRSIQQLEMKPRNGISRDTLVFACDSNLIGRTFKIEYLNKKIESHRIYSTFNQFHIDKNLFNFKMKTVLVSFEYPHPIVSEHVELKVGFPSDLVFQANEGVDFYMIVKPKRLTTLNNNGGPRFMLNQMQAADKLNYRRKLR